MCHLRAPALATFQATMHHQFMVRLHGRRHLQRFARADGVVHRDHRVVDVKKELAWEVARKERPLGRCDIQVPAWSVSHFGHKCARLTFDFHALTVSL